MLQNLLLCTLLLGGNLLVSGAALSKRQDCTPQNMQIDKSYFDCPRKNSLDKNQKCPITDATCRPSYCEIRETVHYGPEVPFPDSRCQANSVCTLAKAKSVSTTTSLTFNVEGGGGAKADDLESAFKVGFSYSFSKTVAYTTTVTNTRPTTNKDQCGYWTFIPYYVESCGTLSTAKQNWSLNGLVCVDDKTIGNWCNTTPAKDSDGKNVGSVVFVFTDCTTNKPIDMKKQDAAYQAPGVSRPGAE